MKKTNKSNILSKEQVQYLALISQELIASSTTKNKTIDVITNLGYIQIDTLAVIARAHHHTLWSRLPNYKEEELNDLMTKKLVFEYWSHAASYLPMSDYRFSLPRKKMYADGKSHWFEQDKKIKKYVLDRIKAEGALQSKDFEFKRQGPGNWFEWKPAKKALEQLFMEGKLMVANRKGFQKIYDLTERIVPSGTNTTLPNAKEYAQHLVSKTIQAHGIVSENEILYMRNDLKTDVNNLLKEQLKAGVLLEVKIEGDNKSYYTTASTLEKLNKKSNSEKTVHLLSPFDNMVIQRKRLQSLFNFDYGIECYLPEAKRKYGYFSLPVLFDNQFVARIDPKADRLSQIFHIKSIHFEKGFKPTDEFNRIFAKKLKSFALFNGCNSIQTEHLGTTNGTIKKLISTINNELK
ncbi:MAG: crosslink repair DNA glycosylase YcaQ family protein [Bacteroidia bacterium]